MNCARINLFLLAVAGWLALTPAVAVAQTNRLVVTPPVPAMKSPVESFRTLLVMPAAERRQFIATRGTNVQQQLTEKIREYQALTPEERELRLQATELRWYLRPLMRLPATNRADRLALVPEHLREMVTARLAQWDKIPLMLQQRLLTNQPPVAPTASVTINTNHPPLPSMHLNRKLAERFDQLFDLTPAEKEKALATLSEAERRQMEKTLEAYRQLSPDQRRQCLVSFNKFAGMNLAERQEFLKNAERWAQMTPVERQSWRELVSAAPNVPPFPTMPVPKPTLPVPTRKPGASFATNGG